MVELETVGKERIEQPPWPEIELGKIAAFVNGYPFNSEKWVPIGRPIIRIQNLTGSSDRFNYYEDDGVPVRYIVRAGDVLVSWSASVDVFIWRGPDAWLNQHIFKVSEIAPTVDKDFLYFALKHRIGSIRDKTRGSTMKHVTRADFLSSRIPVPAISTQREIAHVLRAVQDARHHTDKVIVASRQLKRSVLSHVFTKRPNWTTVPFGEVLREPLRNGHSAPETKVAHGIRTLKLSAVTKGEFSIANTKLTTASPEKARGLWLEPGDILVERANTRDLVGVAALYEGPTDFAIYPDLMIRARVNADTMDPKFVAEFLMTEDSRDYFRRNASGAAGNMPKIGHGTLERLDVPVPGLSEQRLVAEVLRAADRKIAAEEKWATTLNSLFEALSGALFDGGLRSSNLEISSP